MNLRNFNEFHVFVLCFARCGVMMCYVLCCVFHVFAMSCHVFVCPISYFDAESARGCQLKDADVESNASFVSASSAVSSQAGAVGRTWKDWKDGCHHPK